MAYTTPPVVASGDLSTAAAFNAAIRSNWQAFETHGHDGTSGGGGGALTGIGYAGFTDAAAPSGAGVGKTRLYAQSGKPRFRASSTGNDTPLLVAGSSFSLAYLDASGEQVNLAHGPAGAVLMSRSAAAAPLWEHPPGLRWAGSMMLMGMRMGG